MISPLTPHPQEILLKNNGVVPNLSVISARFWTKVVISLVLKLAKLMSLNSMCPAAVQTSSIASLAKHAPSNMLGRPKNTLAKRFYSHFFNVRHHKKTDGVGHHFSRQDHNGTQDFQLHVLDFIRLPPNSEAALALRLKFEKTWIHKLRCPAPRGINIFD